MSILSGASQYANANSLSQGTPYNNVDGNFVNIDGSSYSGGFGSNETSLQYGLPSIHNNVLAADASRNMSGGAKKSKTLRRKIKNITNKYRMPKTKRNAIKRRLTRKYGRRTGKKRTITRSRINKRLICHKKHHHTNKCYRRVKSSRHQRGGYYDQYSNDIPNTPGYATGSVLSPNESMLANPTPIHKFSNLTNCVDNYDYTTNKGFQFW
jgi:hypothetical protein